MKTKALILLFAFLSLGMGSGSPLPRQHPAGPAGEVITKTNELTPDPIELKRQGDKAKFDEERLMFEKERIKRQEEREFNRNTQPRSPQPLIP